MGSGFFNGPPQGQVVDQQGFYDGPSLEQLDPVVVGAYRDEAVAAAAAAKASETSAASSATSAATSASNLHTSETNAAASATSAQSSATAASTSATNAATSETNAASSASSALASKNAAATSETNAATSATSASGSASAASTSATNAATSASNAATSATNAATAVQAAAGTIAPNAPGAAATGTSTKWAHEDHTHPKDSSKTDLASFLAAIPVGQCKFVYTSATQCTLKPCNGNNLKINGQLYQIPAAGITITNAGLTANALWYCYAYINAGAVTLGWWQTAHATSSTAGNVGTEIYAGADDHTLVGMVYTNASSQFVDTNTNRQVRSWFNDTGATAYNFSSTPVSSTSTAWIELDAASRATVLLWSGEQFDLKVSAASYNNTVSSVVYTTGWVNGAVFGAYTYIQSTTASTWLACSTGAASAAASDTLYTFNSGGQVNSGTGTWGAKNTQVTTIRK